jgi:hypothetical protein
MESSYDPLDNTDIGTDLGSDVWHLGGSLVTIPMLGVIWRIDCQIDMRFLLYRAAMCL